MEPVELAVLDVDEREVEARDELAALFGQIDADRLRRLEAFDVVAAEAAVARDHPLAEIELLGVGVHLCQARLSLGQRHQIAEVVQQHGVRLRWRRRHRRRRPRRARQRHQIRRHVGHLRIGEPQVGHVGGRVVVLRIAHPVEQPHVGRLAADALQRLAERAPRSDGGTIVLIDDVAAEATDSANDLLARLRIASAAETPPQAYTCHCWRRDTPRPR